MKDYYKILGVTRDATQQQIKAAYRRLVLQYHPDVNRQPDAHAKFIEINEAYEILYDAEKKKLYDELLSNAKHNVHGNSLSTAQSTYNSWQNEARSKAEGYSKMSIKDFQYMVLDGLVKTYDAAKLVLKVALAVAVLWYFFQACR